MMHWLLVCLGCVLSCAQQRLSRPSLRNGWAWCVPRGARAHLHYWPDPSENDGDEQPSLALVQGRAAAPKRPIVPLPAQRAKRLTPRQGPAAMAAASSMSEREAAVYDRAIRLWGAEAQARLMAAKLLVVGLSGLTAEVSVPLARLGSTHNVHARHEPCAP